ncbi:MAG: hypothetical protein AB7R90_07905 [Reyranellaceae bacterium]
MSDSLVPVARFIDWNEAHIACGFLRTNDIAAVLHDQNMVLANWPLATALGGIKLMVPAEERGMALRLLQDVSRGEFSTAVEMLEPPGDGEDFAIERCPNCNAEDIFRPRSLIASLVGFWFTAVPTPLRTRQRHCRRCGYEWKAETQANSPLV